MSSLTTKTKMEVTKALLLLSSLFISSRSSPILSLDVASVKRKDGKWTFIKYIDMPANPLEYVTLDCKIPLADTYEWKIEAKEGAPYAGSISIGDTTTYDIYKPWKRTITHLEYPWDLLVVRCTALHELDVVTTFMWVVMKMKASTHVPYHPVICEYGTAFCHANKFDCFNNDGHDYRGRYNRTVDGDVCQPWASVAPNQPVKNLIDYDANGHHNYCRNIKSIRFRPWCITSRPKVKISEQRVLCSVPRCHDCMYGAGAGYFPGFRAKQFWKFPSYNGNYIFTVGVDFNKKGEKVPLKCYRGKNPEWKKNICKPRSSLYNRKTPDSSKPYCLAIHDKRIGEDKSQFSDKLSWERLKWIQCVAPQCTVRQVWFLFLGTNGELHHALANKKHVEVPIYAGENAEVRFFHFGTSMCSGMSLEYEERLKGFRAFFKLVCKPTPQMSKIMITKPVEEMAGKYNLRYVFPEGAPLIESVEYKANFELVIKRRSKLVLTSVYICPGYPAKISLSVVGSFKIISNTLKWQYKSNASDWASVDTELTRFNLSPNGLTLTMQNIKENIIVKVSGRSQSGRMEVTQHVNVRARPYLKVITNSVVGKNGEEVVLQIKCNSKAKIEWIFSGLIIDVTTIDAGYSVSSKLEKNKKIESLRIKSLDKTKEGIYTVEITDEGCKNQGVIHVNISS